MADNADRATEIMERRLEGALAKTRLPSRTFIEPFCDDCGVEIPVARRKAAPWCVTCIDCQGIREEKHRHVR